MKNSANKALNSITQRGSKIMIKNTNKSLNPIAPPPPPIIYNYTIEETLKKAYSPTRFFLSKTRKLALFSALWRAKKRRL